jgi:hypothetical protein
MSDILYNQLYTAKKLLYNKGGFTFNELIIENESQEYAACSFRLNDLKIIFRVSKITPAKTGQFVTMKKE